MKLKCSHCGNEELFYIIQTYSGMSCFEVNNAGECDETCNNKVEKIPLEKRF